jgi:uncharacterized membrane protein required for colicin V production
MAGVNQVDIAALALVLAFAYKGYRTGFIAVLLGLTSGLLAFGLAAALAPLLAPLVAPVAAERLRIPAFLILPALVVTLTFALRFVLGYAVRELTGALRLLVRGVPPLALADRLMGIVPAAALGGVLAVAVLAVAPALPATLGVRRHVEDSWVTRTLVNHPERTLQRLRDAGGRLLSNPPRVNRVVLGAGVAGLALATVSAGRLRPPARSAALSEAPTRHAPDHRYAEADTFDPLAWARALLGVGVALAIAAGLVFYAQ